MRRIFAALVSLIALTLAFKCYWEKSVVTPISVLSCIDITKSCGNEMFKVQFSEVPQVMRPLHLSVHFKSNTNVKNVYVDFSMRNMEMGLNRYRLIQLNQLGDWQSEVTLPVCVQGRSDWNMVLEFDDGTVQRFQLPFSARANQVN
jgi:hypothetical protein